MQPDSNRADVDRVAVDDGRDADDAGFLASKR
jgi:hypothetical protein